jgi:hypothetical protein
LIKRVLAALVACLALALAAAACGGGGSDDTGASAPTKAVFIKEADEICANADETMNEEIGEYAEENDIPIDKEEPTTEQQLQIFEAVVLPNVAKQGEEIAALTPPAGDEEAIEGITDSLAAGVEDAEANPKQLTAGKDPLADASKQAHAYGMKSCGSE